MTARLRPMSDDDAAACARIACDSPIGERYELKEDELAATLVAATRATGQIVVAEDGGQIVGFVWIEPRGAFCSAPYLRLIAVSSAARGGGIGGVLLEEFERRTADVGRDWCLLVSDFNRKAIAFYVGHGYAKAGELPDFARPGITEVLMVKRRKGCCP